MSRVYRCKKCYQYFESESTINPSCPQCNWDRVTKVSRNTNPKMRSTAEQLNVRQKIREEKYKKEKELLEKQLKKRVCIFQKITTHRIACNLSSSGYAFAHVYDDGEGAGSESVVHESITDCDPELCPIFQTWKMMEKGR
jgi:hypothetical protein